MFNCHDWLPTDNPNNTPGFFERHLCRSAPLRSKCRLFGEPPNCSPSQGNCSPARWGDPLGDHLECQVGWHLKTGKKYSPWWKKSIKCGMKWDASCWVFMELSWFITLSPWQNMRILLNYRSKVDVARSWFWAYSDRPIYRRIWNHTYLIFERVYHAKPFLPVSVRPLLGWS